MNNGSGDSHEQIKALVSGVLGEDVKQFAFLVVGLNEDCGKVHEHSMVWIERSNLLEIARFAVSLRRAQENVMRRLMNDVANAEGFDRARFLVEIGRAELEYDEGEAANSKEVTSGYAVRRDKQ